MVSVIGWTTDGLTSELFIDDRIAKDLQHYKELVWEEMLYIRSLCPYIWARLAELLPDTTATALCSDCQRVMHRQNAYIRYQTWSQFENDPWNVVVGDPVQTVDQIEAGPQPAGGAAYQIWKLRHEFNYPKPSIHRLLDTMQDTSFVAKCIEEAHTSATLSHRDHPRYNEQHLLDQALSHGLRPFVRKRTAEDDPYLERLRKRIKVEDKKGLWKGSGQSMFVGSCIEGAVRKKRMKGVQVPPNYNTTVMKTSIAYVEEGGRGN